jgi:hypothetical protein
LFLQAQGHEITTNVFNQDNVSAIRLAKNGRASGGKKSRHIDIRFFFIKDRLVSEGITMRHCPTEIIIADLYTKPLQGMLFKRFRDVILGYKHISYLTEIYTRVFSNNKSKVVQEATTLVSSDTKINGKYESVSSNDKNKGRANDERKCVENENFGTEENEENEVPDSGMSSTQEHTPEWSLVVKKMSKRHDTGNRSTKLNQDAFLKLTTLKTIRPN